MLVYNPSIIKSFNKVFWFFIYSNAFPFHLFPSLYSPSNIKSLKELNSLPFPFDGFSFLYSPEKINSPSSLYSFPSFFLSLTISPLKIRLLFSLYSFIFPFLCPFLNSPSNKTILLTTSSFLFSILPFILINSYFLLRKIVVIVFLFPFLYK